jgi:hypothetical protein
MTLRGRVENGVVVFQNGGTLADGTLVEVTPLNPKASTGAALVAAIEAAPRVPPEDVDELENAIEAGKRRVTTSDPWPPTEPAR